MSRVKVLHLIKALGRGGAEVLLEEGCAVADHDRFDYNYAYLQTKPDEVAEGLRAQGAEVSCFHLNSNPQILLGARKIARFLREQHIHLVHAHLPMAGIVGRLAGSLARVPVVYTEHAPLESYHPFVRGLSRLTWQWQKQVIAISEDVAESIHMGAGPQVPVKTIWNGVNTEKFSPRLSPDQELRRYLDIPEDAPLVGTVAVFRNEKRLDLWLESAHMIREAVPGAHFLLVGNGALRQTLEAQCAALGLQDVVHFAGRQTDVRPYLAAMDVFLMSSAFEGFGIAPVEAMSMGVAVVATNVKGVRNVVISGRTGLLGTFDNNAALNLATLVVSLLRDPERRKELAAAGRKAAVEKFSIKRMQRELEAIYDQVLSISSNSGSPWLNSQAKA